VTNFRRKEQIMPNLGDAIALAAKVHQGQVDRAEQPYILHPLRVMFQLEGEVDRIVGILHDVVEDSDTTFEDLRQMDYSETVIEALDGVTRRAEETYEAFVSRSAAHPISRRVKLVDLTDNMDLRRIKGEMSEKDVERIKRYQRAWQRLQPTGE
jgi:(p)ppGpp synthase/HD superfamily hydrolase